MRREFKITGIKSAPGSKLGIGPGVFSFTVRDGNESKSTSIRLTSAEVDLSILLPCRR